MSSYSCNCRAGYTGDGKTCNGKKSTNQSTNKQNAKLILNLITISLYFQQTINFFCNDGLEKTVTSRSCAMRRLKKFKPVITLLLFLTISKPAPLVSNQGHTNHPKAENDSESVESKINEMVFIKAFCAFRKFSTDCSQAICFVFSSGEMVRLTIAHRLSILTLFILFKT